MSLLKLFVLDFTLFWCLFTEFSRHESVYCETVMCSIHVRVVVAIVEDLSTLLVQQRNRNRGANTEAVEQC